MKNLGKFLLILAVFLSAISFLKNINIDLYISFFSALWFGYFGFWLKVICDKNNIKLQKQFDFLSNIFSIGLFSYWAYFNILFDKNIMAIACIVIIIIDSCQLYCMIPFNDDKKGE